MNRSKLDKWYANNTDGILHIINEFKGGDTRMAITEELLFGVIAASEIIGPNVCSYLCCGPGGAAVIMYRDSC